MPVHALSGTRAQDYRGAALLLPDGSGRCIPDHRLPCRANTTARIIWYGLHRKVGKEMGQVDATVGVALSYFMNCHTLGRTSCIWHIKPAGRLFLERSITRQVRLYRRGKGSC